jgi:hypothetical protein
VQIGNVDPEAVWGASDEDLKQRWLGGVHRTLREDRLAGRVLGEVKPPGPGWNYYFVRVQYGDEDPLRILLNAAVGLVAASRDCGVPLWGPLDFCDVPHDQAFRNAGFDVASADALSTPLAYEHTALLTAPQHRDIQYHRPARLGDLLFNWFD